MKGSLFVCLIMLASSASAVTINSSDWPFGASDVGEWWDFYSNTTAVVIQPFDSTLTTWDFTTGPTDAVFRSELRPKTEGPHHSMFGGDVVLRISDAGTPALWWYYSKDAVVHLSYGQETGNGGFQVVYTSPYERMMEFPAVVGDTWGSTWTATLFGVFVIDYDHQYRVVTEGWVKVPAFGPDSMGCLVVEVVINDQDRVGGSIYSDHKITHGWLVPGVGLVAAQTSVSPDQNPQFTNASGFNRLLASSLIVSVPDHAARLPHDVSLSAVPNPFNPTATFLFDLPAASHVRLDVFDVLGQRVATLVDGETSAGNHEVRWDAVGVPSGVYFARLVSENWTANAKIALIK